MTDSGVSQAERLGDTIADRHTGQSDSHADRLAELQKITDRLSLAAELGRLGAWEWEIRTGRVIWSPELERIHGLEPGTFPGTFEAYQSDIHPDDRQRVLRTVSESIEQQKAHVLEYRIIAPDGSVRWLEARGRLFFDDAGRPERLIGICVDATERKQAEAAIQAQHRLAELMAEIGLVLTRADSMRATLQGCAQAVLHFADAAFVRVWTLNADAQMLDLQASAGMYTHLDGPHGRIPVGEFKIGRIARDRRALLSNQVIGDPQVSDQEWAQREGMIAFAGYPLLVGSDLLGVLAMFARHPITAADLQALGAVGHSIALAIQKMRQDEALKQSEANLRVRAAELVHVAAALERSNRELDSFAYAASHDLRAPLRGIANLAQWIEEDLRAQGQLKDENAEMLQLMRSRMHRMESLIEGLLEYSRAGRIHHAPERVDVRRLVRDVVDLLAAPEAATIDIEGDLPTLTTERLPLQQVFLNLIGNALKHAKRGDPHVTVTAREDGRFWEFAVRDNGPGVPPQFHERIWGIFQTLEARDRVEGAGIGLALVKKLVESQGGRARVESNAGDGATFTFQWPR
jgi:PAS domain S-box-containing protein